ncbi:MAG: hypothetical protein Ct9H300mP27_09950 [Chloroflexota bacterium]|nr:MAG: hypothetical protein Ct9H300mP27_09950 [Chloroflexota bacterium]
MGNPTPRTSDIVNRLSSEESQFWPRELIGLKCGSRELQKYDLLRKKKGGTAVAKVERASERMPYVFTNPTFAKGPDGSTDGPL